MTDLKVETGLQQLVHSLRRQAAVGQKEGGESLVGSQVSFHWQIWGGNRNTDHYQEKTGEVKTSPVNAFSCIHWTLQM